MFANDALGRTVLVDDPEESLFQRSGATTSQASTGALATAAQRQPYNGLNPDDILNAAVLQRSQGADNETLLSRAVSSGLTEAEARSILNRMPAPTASTSGTSTSTGALASGATSTAASGSTGALATAAQTPSTASSLRSQYDAIANDFSSTASQKLAAFNKLLSDNKLTSSSFARASGISANNVRNLWPSDAQSSTWSLPNELAKETGVATDKYGEIAAGIGSGYLPADQARQLANMLVTEMNKYGHSYADVAKLLGNDPSYANTLRTFISSNYVGPTKVVNRNPLNLTAQELLDVQSGKRDINDIEAERAAANVASTASSTAATSDTKIPTLTDYQGKTYGGDVIARLARQISQNLDTSNLRGSAFGVTVGEDTSIGFSASEAKKLLGRMPTAPEMVILDMARGLASQGITDISDLGKYKPTEVEETVEGEGSPITQTVTKLINPETGKEFTPGFGATYTGEGGTGYHVEFDSEGKPKFYTSGISTSDAGKIMPLLTLATLPFGGVGGLLSGVTGTAGIGGLAGAALGELGMQTAGSGLAGALASAGLSETLANIGANALVSGGFQGALSELAGGNFAEGFKSGALGGLASGLGSQVSSMLPKELAAVGSNAITQLITTGKLDPAALATSVGTSLATDALAAETGLDKATAGKLVTAGLQALQGNELAALTSLTQAGLQSGQSTVTGASGTDTTSGAAGRDDNVTGGGGALISSGNPTEDQLIDVERRTNAANQLLSDYTASGSDISRDDAIARLTSLGVSATRAQELITNADSQVEQRRVASDVMSRYEKIDPEFGTPQLDRQTAIDEMVASGISTSRANELLNDVDEKNAIKLENKLNVQAAYNDFLNGTGTRDQLRSAMMLAGYTDAEINNLVTRGNAIIEGGKLTPGEQAQERASNLPNVRADIAAKPTFNEAYALAREKFGAGATFTWQGKSYSTATFQEDPKLGLVEVAGSGRGTATGKTAAQEAALENTRQQLLLSQTAAKPTGLFSGISNWLSNQMNLSSQAAQQYLQNNPNSPITQSVSTAYEAAGQLLSNVGGGTALLLDNKPVADAFIKGGSELQKLGQSIGTGPQDTANFNTTMQLLNAAQGPQEKLSLLAGRVLDGTSGLGRQIVVELRQELPALFLGGAGVKTALVASGLIDTADTAGNAAIDAYDGAIKIGKTHEQALSDARTAGAAAGATEAAIQLTLGKIGSATIGQLDNVAGKAVKRVVGEGLTEGGQEAGSSVAVDLALGQGADLNKALTQGIVGSAIGKGTAISTAPISTAQDITTALEASKASGVSSTESINSTVTAALSGGVSPSTIVSSVTGSGLTSVGDVSALTTSIIQGSKGDVTANVGSTVTAVIDSAIANGGTVSSTITAVVGSSITAGVGAGGNMASVVGSATSSAITAAVSGGASVETATVTAIGSAISTGIQSGGDASTVITAAVDSAIKSSGGDAEAVSSSLQTAASTALSSGGTATSVTTTTINAAVAGGVNAATAASSTIAGVVAAGGNLQQAVDAAEAATGAKVITSQTDGKTVITATDGSLVTKTVFDPTSNVTITSTTDLTTNKTVTTISDSGLKADLQATQESISQIRNDLSTAIINAANSGADADKVITESIDKIASDLGITKGDLLKQLGETEASLRTELSTELSRITEAINKQAKAAKTASANQAALAAASQIFRGASSPEDWLGGKLLASKRTGEYVDPLAKFEALQEDAQRMEMMQQVAPELADVLSERGMPLPHYSYGDEQPIDDILATEEEPVYRSGGSVSPLNIQMMYAKGGHAREDFRHGKHVEGPGDGQSDDIPAWLADGEFVFPADVVAALGNGSTKAGTKKLYDMMHAIRHRSRSKGPKDLPPPALKSPLDYLKYRK
jgi:hypothetical protein